MTIRTGWSLRAVLLATAVTLASAGGAAWAQNSVEKSTPEKLVNVPTNVLSIGDIESRLSAQGIKVKEIEVRDLLAEVEGYDAKGREIEVMVDRRSGEILSHKYDR